ncbi:hypothetical protein [Novipirellula sp.]
MIIRRTNWLGVSVVWADRLYGRIDCMGGSIVWGLPVVPIDPSA